MSLHPPPAVDAAERARALDPRTSFLVQAPAGSGKTELLVLRYLALLPTVERPEQILAITFTRKATAEMRARILAALEDTNAEESALDGEHKRELRRLARAALAHAQALEWRLLEQPQRLNIQTIDSLALAIAHQTPLISQLGGSISPVENADPLYALAAERTLSHLGSEANPHLAAALADMLRLRDASLSDCESLIAAMLAKRDQWLLVLPIIAQRDLPWDDLLGKLEEPFRREHDRTIAALKSAFAPHLRMLPELLDLARIACDRGKEGFDALRNAGGIEDWIDAGCWQAMAHLLLNKEHGWRKQSHIPAKDDPIYSARFKAAIHQLNGDDRLREWLEHVRTVPPPAYTEQEQKTVRSIFTVLRHAMAELRVIFAQSGIIDFAEAGIAALNALADPGVLLRLDGRVQHLLVDEFQDTSRPHFALLRALLEDWQPGDGQSCFLVGDPMQSIYLFRDAESRLFQQVRRRGLETDSASLPIAGIQLAANFRSTPAMVAALNSVFEPVLGAEAKAGAEDDAPYAASVAAGSAQSKDAALRLHVQAGKSGETEAAEAEAMVDIIRDRQQAVAQAQASGGRYRIAVLGRTRTHLAAVLERLRQEKIPFRGVNIDLLRERPEILDLLSLLRALLHPADRIAWLAVLRAPWCGLTLPALHAICGDLEDGEAVLSIPALLEARAGRLDEDSRARALRVLSVLRRAESAYAAGALAASPSGLALWLERVWHALGAPAYLDGHELANCRAFFAALAEMPPSCFGTLDESLNQRLKELFALPDPQASEDCGVQLMTIHGAKGLEFEVVLLPQLDRWGKSDDQPLFQWMLRRGEGLPHDELLLAPIGRKHGDTPRLYEWIREQSARRQREEEKRLLYVACSRSIEELHLFATLGRKKDGGLAQPAQGSLLAAGWQGLAARVAAAGVHPPEKLLAFPPASDASGIVTSPRTATSPGILTTLAAGADTTATQRLHRLPSSWFVDRSVEAEAHSPAAPASFPARGPAEQQESGNSNRTARAQGIVLHALLERAAAGVSGPHPEWGRLADALLRQFGLTAKETALARASVIAGMKNTLLHPAGRWLLTRSAPGDRSTVRSQQQPSSEQSGAEQSGAERAWSEQSWTSEVNGRLLRQRPDQVFFAGASPAAPGSEYLWIVDYKSAPRAAGEAREAFLAASRERYRDQLEGYSALFRKLTDFDPSAHERKHRLAIYHPMLPWLDWWPG